MTSMRCEHCKKKLGISEYKCRCGKIFCITHLHAEAHNCTFDYKALGQETIKKQIEIGPLTQKIERI
jgi:hypothetical protein